LAIVEMHIAKLGGNSPPVRRIESEGAGRRYIDFLVPGLLAANAMGASLVFFGYGLTEWRMMQLLRVLLATPLTKAELIGGFLLARAILLLPEAVAVLLVARVGFGVELAGNVLGLLLVLLIGAGVFSAVGLLIGARGRRLEAASGWVSVLMLSQWVFCGVFFSRSVFPETWQPLLSWLPLSLFADATREIMQDGKPLFAVSQAILLLAVWGVVCGTVGRMRFRID
jgi:ABC-type multidrug transport system permease subunit